MKDGKLIPFRDCIKCRKALKDTISEDEVKQIRTRLTDNRPEMRQEQLNIDNT